MREMERKREEERGKETEQGHESTQTAKNPDLTYLTI